MSHVHRRISLAEGTRNASRAQQLGPYDGTPADGAIRARQAEGRTHPDTRRRDICATRGPSSCTASPTQLTSGNNGNVWGIFDQDTANPQLQHTEAFNYDGVNRLLTAAATGNSTYNLTFSYDIYGNMTCVQNGSTNGPCPVYSFDGNNHLTSGGVSYDAAGNVIADSTTTPTHTFQWDAEGRLISVDNGSTYMMTYNALGQRAELAPASGNKNEYLYGASGDELGWFYPSGVCVETVSGTFSLREGRCRLG
jgi:YD repeat-containing protein